MSTPTTIISIAKKEKQPLSVKDFAERGTSRCPSDAEYCEENRARPSQVLLTDMVGKIDEGICRNSKRTGTGCHMRLKPRDIEQERGCHDRASTADQAGREPNEGAAQYGGERIKQRYGPRLSPTFGRGGRCRAARC